MTGAKPTIFISYSHKDEKWKDRLLQHLRVLGAERDFDAWDDQRIAAGDAWKEEIERAIATASVAVLLVSVDFLDSRFVREEEVPKLLRRREQDNLPVVPVILRSCTWKDIPWLRVLQARPKNGKPLAGRAEHEIEKWLTRIAREIKDLMPRGPEAAHSVRASVPAVPSPLPESHKPTAPSHKPGAPAEGEQDRRARSASPESVPRVPVLAAPAAAPVRSGGTRVLPPTAPASLASQPAPKSSPGAPLPAPPTVPTASTPLAVPVRPAARAQVRAVAVVPAPKAREPQRVGVPRMPPIAIPRSRERVPPRGRSVPWRQVGLAAVLLLAVAGVLYGAYRMIAGHPPAAAAATSAPTPSLRVLAAPRSVVLHPLEFETVTVDDRGAVRERRRLQAQSFTEDLGNGVALEMVAIPGGTFTMGSLESEDGLDSERPPHFVTVASFYMSQFEVTQAQWRAVAALPRVTRELEGHSAHFEGADRPVERVLWHDAVEFCARLSDKSGRTYRLPSESEWEYAARAGTTTPFAFGPTITADLVNYDGNYPYGNAPKGEYRQSTTKVGLAGYGNAFGLFDMHGNVWEWTQDVWHENYTGAPNDGGAWETGGYQNRHVLRGGAWGYDARNCRSAVRGRNEPKDRSDDWGLRVVCSVSRTP